MHFFKQNESGYYSSDFQVINEIRVEGRVLMSSKFWHFYGFSWMVSMTTKLSTRTKCQVCCEVFMLQKCLSSSCYPNKRRQKNVAYLTYYVGRYCKIILRAFTKITIISELKLSNEISLCPILKLAPSSLIKVLFHFSCLLRILFFFLNKLQKAFTSWWQPQMVSLSLWFCGGCFATDCSGSCCPCSISEQNHKGAAMYLLEESDFNFRTGILKQEQKLFSVSVQWPL